MKHFVIAIAALVLVACDETPTRESDTGGWKVVCVEKYEYIVKNLNFRSGVIAPKFGPDRMPVKCVE